MHEQSFPEAETAISAADIVDKQKSGVLVLVFEAGSFGIKFLVGRIETAACGKFAFVRDDDTADGVVGIVPVDEGKIVLVGSEGEGIAHFPEIQPLFSGQSLYFIESGNVFRVFHRHSFI